MQVQGIMEVLKGGGVEMELLPVTTKVGAATKAGAAGLAGAGAGKAVVVKAGTAAAATGVTAKVAVSAKPLLAFSGLGVTVGTMGTLVVFAGVALAGIAAYEFGKQKGWLGRRSRQTDEDVTEDEGFFAPKEAR